MFADSLAPEVIAAIAAGVRGRVQVDPVNVGTTGDPVAAGSDALTVEPEAPLQPVQIDATSGVEVDPHFVCHVLLPIQAYVTRSVDYYTGSSVPFRRRAEAVAGPV